MDADTDSFVCRDSRCALPCGRRVLQSCSLGRACFVPCERWILPSQSFMCVLRREPSSESLSHHPHLLPTRLRAVFTAEYIPRGDPGREERFKYKGHKTPLPHLSRLDHVCSLPVMLWSTRSPCSVLSHRDPSPKHRHKDSVTDGTFGRDDCEAEAISRR